MSVFTQPGQIAFTWIRRGASSAANARTSPSRPAFDAQYAGVPGDADAREDRRGDDDAPAVGEQRLGGAAAPVGAVEVRLDDVVQAVAVAGLVRAADPGVRDERVERLGRTPRSTASRSRMSTDARRRAVTTSRRRDSSRASSVSRAPSAARRCAIARPIPVPAPVTTTCFPSRRFTQASLRSPPAAPTVQRARRATNVATAPCRPRARLRARVCVS